MTQTEKTSRPGFRVIGSSPLRQDGVEKVTGRARFGADIHLPGLLIGAVLRSPHAHARILAIDTSAAAAYPGVKAVVTALDLPELESKIADIGEASINQRYQSNNILARDKVLYFGHAVAAVAAVNGHVAEAAAALIKVDYEVLPPVLDVRAAMAPDAPILLEELRTAELGDHGTGPTNVAAHLLLETGDIARGFEAAAVVVERAFTTAMVHQGYIEPHAATAQVEADGQVTIWCSTQGTFGVREQVASILRLPLSRIRVVPLEIGGGFGGKNNVYLEPLAVLLSRKSGFRPVKLTMSRKDVLAATGPTSGSVITVKLGADAAGKLTAAQATLIYEAGAYPGSPVGSAMDVIFTPYRIPHVRIDGYDVVVNKPHTAAYRAPGGTNAAFAAESVVDELSERLGLDPIAFRLLNGVHEGNRKVDGVAFERIGLLETLEAAQSTAHYRAAAPGRHRGRGVAAGFWGNYGGKSSASASVNADGTISLIEGSVDIGGSRTSIAMQLAETLELPIETVRTTIADTDSIGETEGTYGSRTTFATGWAAYEVGQKLKVGLKERAAHLWGVTAADVDYADGVFRSGAEHMTFAGLAAQMDGTGGPVVASASVQPSSWGPGFAVHIVDVEVDPETGKVDILRYTALQDAGKAVYPDYVAGQMQGGAAQGIGWALHEEFIYDGQGRLLNANWLDYRMPVSLDLPFIETVIVEVPSPSHPYGVRGVGEVPIVPPAAAVANAIYRAIGVRLTELPMSPGRIVAALRAQDR
ncbi:MAG: xanthine dehydrogenase family protein molybdopterin-binding subunit [Anaerolineales bacterium]|nr:xanthine dehydrogenase family protein molybdopterin-binding subunit [Anaerolineales bacterium]